MKSYVTLILMIPLGFEINNKKISLNIYDKNGIKIYSSCKNSSI